MTFPCHPADGRRISEEHMAKLWRAMCKREGQTGQLPPSPQVKLTPEALARRRAKVHRLRKLGTSYREIARLLNIDPKAVGEDVRALRLAGFT